MMHYGFCRKHADQTGEGGCPECAMNHQQATISAMTETAKEANRVHVELHNQNVDLQAEVARLERQLDDLGHRYVGVESSLHGANTHIAELEAGMKDALIDCEFSMEPKLHSDLKALLGNNETNTNNQGEINA